LGNFRHFVTIEDFRLNIQFSNPVYPVSTRKILSMFVPYYNFKENPFNLTIDTAYLYLGRHHEEATAHLTYAVSEGEGFSVITGERGVGKTTVCRSFLEGLDANVETAYIDRSTSNPQKLLLDITAKFKIRSGSERIKDLADALNEFLIQKKLAGKKVAVIIDDAHKLNNDVLEQIRLISNLETSRDKLLQLVLIGEPKLSEMLNSNELRQIGQRVSVAYCIGPLSHDETVGYIQHRLTIATKGPPIRFDPKAVRRIFKYACGIPRNINIACNQALEIAYRQKLTYIDTDIARATIRYLSDRAEPEKPKPRHRWVLGTIVAICCLISAIAVAAYFIRYDGGGSASKKVITEKVPVATGQAMAMPKKTAQPSPVTPESQVLKEDIPKEPIQADQPAGPAGTSDPSFDRSEIEPRSPQMMTHSVQVGAFRRMDNAEDLINRLEAKGYSARIVEIPDSQGRLWFTVRIGDHSTLESAQEQARIFMENENVRTLVRPYKAY
jgi:type II secretory pathway predicted ATPase ExeA/cell division septation protein DedD